MVGQHFYIHTTGTKRLFLTSPAVVAPARDATKPMFLLPLPTKSETLFLNFVGHGKNPEMPSSPSHHPLSLPTRCKYWETLVYSICSEVLKALLFRSSPLSFLSFNDQGYGSQILCTIMSPATEFQINICMRQMWEVRLRWNICRNYEGSWRNSDQIIKVPKRFSFPSILSCWWISSKISKDFFQSLVAADSANLCMSTRK